MRALACAWLLGFFEHIGAPNSCGRSWRNDQGCNEAYDRGWNAADFIRRRKA
jgi:hypothetical protein